MAKNIIELVTKSKKYKTGYLDGTTFGMRDIPELGMFNNYHVGCDYNLPSGTPLYAPTDGMFLKTVRDGVGSGYGNYIQFYMASEDDTLHLAHLRNIEPLEGKQIKAGDLIGHSGNTGQSTGAHLHLGIAPGKKTNLSKGKLGDKTWVDPEHYTIKEAGKLLSVHEIAKEVIKNPKDKWGTGNTRKERLKNAGYDPKEVQDEVNRLLRGKDKPTLLPLRSIALEVIENKGNKWNTGEARKNNLKKAGYNPSEVQAEINKIMKAKEPASNVGKTAQLRGVVRLYNHPNLNEAYIANGGNRYPVNSGRSRDNKILAEHGKTLQISDSAFTPNKVWVRKSEVKVV